MSDPKDPNEPPAPEEPSLEPAPPEPSDAAKRIESDPALSPAGAMGAAALSGSHPHEQRTIGAGAPDAAFEHGAAGSGDKTMAVVIYVLHLAGLITGGLTSIAGVILAYMSKAEAPDWLRTHYIFQIRTFWIAFVAFLVGVSTAVIGVGVLLILGSIVWFVVRCAVGMNWLFKGQAYPNCRTWMV